jgi:peptidyl-prolyl cis-trans isomerase B (cyclophilin B)
MPDTIEQTTYTGSAAAKPDPNEVNSLAIVSLALAGGALVVGIPAALAAIICGHIAWAQLRRNPQRGRGIALSGIIGGYVMLVVSIAIALVAFAFIATWPYLLWGLAGA